MTQKNPVSWFEIYVDEMPRAIKFYEAVLAIKLEKLDMPAEANTPPMEMITFPSNMEGYGATGALVKMEGYPAGGMGTIIYFECDDCSLEESRVVAAGGKIEQTKISIGEFGFMSLIQDCEGNMIGLHSMA